jgi:hypothetical protein
MKYASSSASSEEVVVENSRVPRVGEDTNGYSRFLAGKGKRH